jgi:hypothetical protein
MISALPDAHYTSPAPPPAPDDYVGKPSATPMSCST